jgi:hypothetical protein
MFVEDTRHISARLDVCDIAVKGAVTCSDMPVACSVVQLGPFKKLWCGCNVRL